MSIVTFSLSTFAKDLAIGKSFEKPSVTPETQIKAAIGVIERTVPGISKNFKLEIIPQEDDRDVYELEQDANKVILRGSTGVALCSAFNRYLMDYCKCDVSWCGDQLNVPNPLPKIPKKIRQKTPSKYRVYMNYCTFSYSAPWWDWERWQKEIDFMALKGINMPLTVVGLEAVWYNTLLKFGYTSEEAQKFLVAPTHQAWQWMTNIESFGGPLPVSWIKSHFEMGQKVIRRQYELGMMPIQQAFSGYVPRSFKEKFPDVEIMQKRGWCGFEGTAEIDPLDPMFKKFGEVFLKENIRLFGEGHNYAADPFHESSPPRHDKEYLAAVGKTILKIMRDVDPDATWIMQGWTPHEGIVTAIPKGDLVMLDLTGGRHSTKKNFWGHYTVIGSLHNFGGRINMHGDLGDNCRNRMVNARKKAPNVVGMGLFMEGITQNPVFYNNQLDMIWREDTVDPVKWLHNYAERRYGAKSNAAEKAWEILYKTVYSRGTSGVESSSIIAARPALDCRKSGPNAGFGMRYKPEDLIPALDLLLKDSEKLQSSEGYRFDVMDLTRQILTNLGQELHNDVRIAYASKDKAAFKKASERFLGLLADVDRLLATRDEYSFHKWIRDARKWATNEAEKKQYEKNASMLITHWGPDEGRAVIFDYGWREWSGLIGGYYLGRWKEFHKYLAKTLEQGKQYNDTLPGMRGRQGLKDTPFLEKLTKWELDWINSKREVLEKPEGDTIAIAQELLKKYRPDIKRVYTEKHKKQVTAFKNRYQDTSSGEVIGTLNYEKTKGLGKIDLTKKFRGEGRYRFQFNSKRGGVVIEQVQIMLSGSPIWTHKKTQSLRKPEFPGIVTFPLEGYAFGSTYELEVKFKPMSHIKPDLVVRMKYLVGQEAPDMGEELPVVKEPVRKDDPDRVGGWKPGELSPRLKKVQNFDVSRIVTGPGKYEVIIKYEKGTHKLVTFKASLQSGDKIIAEDAHEGETGNRNLNNIYILEVKKKPATPVILKTLVKTHGGNNSSGSVRIKKK